MMQQLAGLVQQFVDGFRQGDIGLRALRCAHAPHPRCSVSTADLLSSETWSTSSKSWSSVASQKMGTCSMPVSAVAWLARAMAVAAFSRVSSGPPSSTTCWPGDDSPCAGAQLRNVGQRGRSRTKREALPFKRIGQGCGVSLREFCSGRLHPLIADRVGPIPLAQGRVRIAGAQVEEVAEEFGSVRQRCNGDTFGAHPIPQAAGQFTGASFHVSLTALGAVHGSCGCLRLDAASTARCWMIP